MSRVVMTIRCDNAEEYEKLAPMLSASGYRWLSGENPMKWNPYSDECSDTKLYINLYSNHIIKYDDNDNYMDAISVETYRIKEGIKVNKFTKADLKDGMVVGLRNGDYCMYFQQWNTIADYSGHVPMSSYDEDLYERIDHNLDIMEVYKLDTVYSLKFSPEDSNMELVWSRTTETTEMTIAEIEEKLGVQNLKIVKEKNDATI